MLNAHVFRTNVVLAAFFTYIRALIRKTRAFNVDEIDGRGGQFFQPRADLNDFFGSSAHLFI